MGPNFSGGKPADMIMTELVALSPKFALKEEDSSPLIRHASVEVLSYLAIQILITSHDN